MNQQAITPEVVSAHNLTPEEFTRIKELLGREPTLTELGIFSVMWSEHCSYKSSRIHLKRLPTTGERVIVPPGENAGVVDVGDGWCVAFKVESHNHPSFIEPFQGAATGVGGILRDIFTMGARPIAAMNSLRFGRLDHEENGRRNRALLAGVVSGIAHYGNCLTGDERITVRHGANVEWLTIGDFCERFTAGETAATIELDGSYQILSFDEAEGVAAWRSVRRVFRRQAKKTLRLKTSKGRALRVTPDHVTLVCTGGKLQQRRAGDLHVGDALPVLTHPLSEWSAPTQLDLIELLGDLREDIWVSYELQEAELASARAVMLPLVATAYARHNYRRTSRYPLRVYLELERHLKLNRAAARLWLRGGKSTYVPAVIPVDEDFARLLGYYLAEGCTSANGTTDKIVWVFGENLSEQEYVADVCRILDRYGLKYSVRETGSTRAVWLSSWFLGALFRRVLGIGANAHRKAIPEVIARQPQAIVDELVKGLLRGDGSVVFYPPEKGSRVRVTWATVSRRLFEQVLLHLQAKGIVPSIYTKPARDTVINGHTYACRPAYYLEFRDYESIRAVQSFFSTIINQRIASELDSTNGTLHSFPRHRQHAGFAALALTEIEEVNEPVSVYDLEVDDTHNFVTSGGLITHNCFGVATVGGEVAFDDAYALNPLVNAFALGLVRHDQIFFGKAEGVGNPVLYVGAKTGRDGIHGATMASAEFDDEALEKRPTVQVGDPFLEKLLLEACLEVMRSGAVAGIQDMGAAGLTSSSCEMAARAANGIELNLELVPQREEGMTAYEIMLSESQERMLLVAHRGRERQVIDIFRKWDLDAVVIGRVTDTGKVVVLQHGEKLAEIPGKYLTDEAPRYERPMRAPDTSAREMNDVLVAETSEGVIGNASVVNSDELDGILDAPSDVVTSSGEDHNDSLVQLLASPNLASKEWVFRQYDHMVRTNTAVLPGADAAVVRIKETRRALAMCLDGNGRYCAVNPREGARLVVAEAARNVVCVGARPLAITNCLNFASPERPEVMWAFSEVVDGMAEACRALGTPVVSGNVSFYNETEGRGVLPTPVIGMVGLVEDVRRTLQHGFKSEGHLIALVGETGDDLTVSEYAATVRGLSVAEMVAEGARLPRLDLERERAVQETVLRAAEEGLLQSAHDCSDGGLAVALAECCFSSLNRAGVGAEINLENDALSTRAHLFAETPSRILLSFEEGAGARLEEIASAAACHFRIIGRTGGARLHISVGGAEAIAREVSELEHAWRSSLGDKLMGEVLAAAAE